jgi:hypothetical protein
MFSFVRLYVACSHVEPLMHRYHHRKGRPHEGIEHTYDATHLFVAHAKANPQSGLPEVSMATAFEVVATLRFIVSQARRFRAGSKNGSKNGRAARAAVQPTAQLR